MTHFLKKVLLFCAIFFLLDKLAILLLDRSTAMAYDPRLMHLVEGEVNQDIIVAGSSRGAKGIIAQQIQDSTGYSVYNLCYNGTDVTFHEFIIRTLLKYNSPPKAILLTADDPCEFWEMTNYGFRSDLVAPLVAYDHCNNEMIANKAKPYVSKFLLTARLSYMHFWPKEEKIPAFDTLRAGGSQWLSYYPENREFERYRPELNPEKEIHWKKKALKKIVGYCKTKGVKLIMVYPPNYVYFNPDFSDQLKASLGPDVMHYIYDHQNPAYQDKSLFYDPDHLHVSGARVFTDELIGYLKTLEL